MHPYNINPSWYQSYWYGASAGSPPASLGWFAVACAVALSALVLFGAARSPM